MPEVKVILVVSKGKTLTWLDDCRIPYQSEDDADKSGWQHYDNNKGLHSWNELKVREGDRKETVLPRSDRIQDLSSNEKGRFPANLLVSDDALNDGRITKSGGNWEKWGKATGIHSWNQMRIKQGLNQATGKSDHIQKCTNPIDEGSYSRYFDLDIWAKTHNIAKPLSLISYLITMGSREGDLVLSDSRIATENLKRKWMGKKKECYY